MYYVIESGGTRSLQDDEGAAQSHPVHCRCALCIWRFGARSRFASSPLAFFPITIAEYDAVFATAVAELKIMYLLFTPHRCRHGGGAL